MRKTIIPILFIAGGLMFCLEDFIYASDHITAGVIMACTGALIGTINDLIEAIVKVKHDEAATEDNE